MPYLPDLSLSGDSTANSQILPMDKEPSHTFSVDNPIHTTTLNIGSVGLLQASYIYTGASRRSTSFAVSRPDDGYRPLEDTSYDLLQTFWKDIVLLQDSEIVAYRKKLISVICLCATAHSCIYSATAWVLYAKPVFALPALAVQMAVAGRILYLLAGHKPLGHWLTALLWSIFGSILLTDHQGASQMSSRMWPGFMLLLHIFTALGRSPWRLLMAITAWMFLTELRRLSSFPLLDVTSFDFSVRAPDSREPARCASPPCTETPGIVLLDTMTNVLFIAASSGIFCTYIAHATALNAVCGQSSNSAHKVVDHLANMNLVDAENILLDDADRIESGLRSVIWRVLDNLRAYRPYLPPHLLQDDNLCDDADALFPPNTPGPGSDSGGSSAGRSPQAKSVRKSSRDESPASSLQTSLNISSSLSGASRRVSQAVRPGDVPILRRLKVTLLRLMFLKMPDPKTTPFHERHNKLISWALLCFTERQSGVLDAFSGDHLLVSFNASKRCNSRETVATKSALDFQDCLATTDCLADVDVRGVLATSEAFCGPLGTSEMMKYCVVAQAWKFLGDTYHAVASWGISLLCDRATHEMASLSHAIVLVLRSLTAAPNDPIYKVLQDVSSDQTEESGDCKEWMYELNGGPGPRWEPYTKVGKKLLMGQVTVEAALEELKESHTLRMVFQCAVESEFNPGRVQPYILSVKSPGE